MHNECCGGDARQQHTSLTSQCTYRHLIVDVAHHHLLLSSSAYQLIPLMDAGGFVIGESNKNENIHYLPNENVGGSMRNK